MRILPLTLVAAALMAMAGCTPAVEQPSEPGTYSTVEELKAAFEAVGGDCSEWDHGDHIVVAAESGDCDGNTVLSIYANDADKQTAVADLSELSESIGGVVFLVGDNWIINDADAVALQEQLGGEVVDTTKG